MQVRTLDEYDPLEDFETRRINLNGVTKVVHVSGAGPAVIVLPELPGISPHPSRETRDGCGRRASPSLSLIHI